jgi:hypothetical protein
MMWRVFAIIFAIISFAPAHAARIDDPKSKSTDAGLRLMKEYRANPDPRAVPPLIRALSERSAFKDPETSGVYVGFLAGVLGSNPRGAKTLIEQTLPLPFEDQWFVIRAVAYSGLPHWRDLMRDLAKRMPDRKMLADHYLSGKLPTLETVELEPKHATPMDKVRRVFKRETYFGPKKEPQRQLTFVSNPELIDTHWGIYFATGKDTPIRRILILLPWSKERDNVEKLTIGGMAKFTLAANAARDAKLLRLLKRLAPEQSKAVQPLLDEVIEAAETADIGRIKKEALASVEDLHKKGPGSQRDISWWGQVGQTTLSLGCLGAAVAGQIEFGLPCVVGGALSTAALRYFSSPE